jgi:quinol monooxygenase YgiN
VHLGNDTPARRQPYSITGEDPMLTVAKGSAPAEGQLALAVTWEAKEGEVEIVASILGQMADAVKAEPGTLMFWAHRSTENSRIFFLYELYTDEAALAAHQQTEWFKKLVLADALPRLVRRERMYVKPMQPQPA